MDSEELIEFLSEMDEALREAIRFTKRGCPSRLIIEKLEDAQKELLDRLNTVAEKHREECLRNGHCPKCGGSLNYRVDLGIDVGTCTRCGATYE